jgi:hypothetical protein
VQREGRIREKLRDAVRKYPRSADNSFTRDIRERHVREFHPVNICDRVAEAPFSE